MRTVRYYLIATVWLLILLPACAPPPPPSRPTPRLTATLAEAITPAIPPVLRSTTPIATPTPRPTLALTPAITEIIVWENLPPAQAERLAQDVLAFENEFPQYQITLQHFGEPQSFIASIGEDQANFDVVLASPPLLNSLWATEQIAPMSDFFPPSFIDAFAAPTLVGATQDGDLWGLSDTAGFHLLLFYNRALVDTPPTDMAELFDLAQNLTRGNQWGLAVNSYDPLWLIPWLTPYGGWLIDKSGQPTLDGEAMVASLTLYQSWQVSKNAIAPLTTYEEARRQFVEGNVAMVIDGAWALGELSLVDDLDWGVALLPRLGDVENDQAPAPLVLARYWAISRSSAGNRALAAATFLEYVTRPERQLVWTTQFGLLPTRREALNDPIIVNDPWLRASAAQMRAGRSLPLGLEANTLLEAMREPLRGLIDGELSPEEAAEMMQANLASR